MALTAITPSSLAFLSPQSSSSSTTTRRLHQQHHGPQHHHESGTTTTTSSGGSPTTRRRSLSSSSSYDRDELSLTDFELTTPDADVLDLRPGQRLVCVGDVHGDADALRTALSAAGLIERHRDGDDRDCVWTGDDAVLVQTGDVLDRGDAELECWRTLASLSRPAADAGGAVVVLYGNHEVMNCMGDFHYTTGDSEYRRFMERLLGNTYDDDDEDDKKNDEPQTNTGSLLDLLNPPRHQPARQAVYEPGTGLLVHPLLGRLKVAVKVGRTLCVHAGLTAQHLSEGGLTGLNTRARRWVEDGGSFPAAFAGSDGPVWTREYSHPCNVQPTSPSAAQHLDGALFCAGADRMVVGHTVQTDGINAALDGRVWRIDTGASRGVSDGVPECLEVVRDVTTGREIVSVITGDGRRLSADRRRARDPVLVERVAQAVTDNVTTPVAEAVLGVELDK